MMDELLNVTVIVADRPYRLKIKPEEEENVRRAAKLVNQKVKDFQKSYAAKDKQDYLAMSALMYAVETFKDEGKVQVDESAFTQTLDRLDESLTDFLQS